jgi:hypothetical protein
MLRSQNKAEVVGAQDGFIFVGNTAELGRFLLWEREELGD